jgi:hypothetical protein
MRLLMYMLVLSCVIAATPQAPANLYWIAYEGNDFPENEGWMRIGFGSGTAQRSIEDGVFILDTRSTNDLSDFYRISRQMNPDAGELFVAQWRLRVVENAGNVNTADAGISIAPDFPGSLGLRYFVDRVTSLLEDWSYPIDPLEFHSYRLESTDMIDYRLSIDAEFVLTGQWDLISTNQGFLSFGDAVRGARSLTEWEYVRFGVVPEPSTLSLLSFLLLIGALRWRSGAARRLKS